VKTVLLVAKKGKSEAASLAQKIRERYPELELCADQKLAEALGWPVVGEAELDRMALVVVLGGDGTLIYASRLLAGRPVPILGVNLGSLGFMTEIPQGELFACLESALEGRFQVDRRMKLRCRLWRNNHVFLEDEVLNDVVINKGALARIADHEMSIDGEYVTSYKSDGMIVATPTGSTAYALSAGGPIVHPSTDAVVVAPICPHALTQRAIVVPGDRTISIALRADVVDVFLTIDGQSGIPLEAGDRLDVVRSPNEVLLIRNPDIGYFQILRQKLRWGER